MATKQQLETGLVNAHKAGDAKAATIFAKAIQAGEYEDKPSVLHDPKGALQRPTEFASGINKGLANILGLPVDAAAGFLRLLGAEGDVVDKPAFSSEHLKSLLSSINAIGEPQDATGEVLDRVGQEVGANAVPSAAIMNKARQTGQIVAPATNAARGLVNDIVGAAKTNPAGFVAADTASAVASGSGAAAAQQIAPDSKTAEVVGALVPAVSLAGAQSAIRGAARGGDTGRRVLAENIDTFERAGVSPSVGQASGRPAVQGFETIISKLPGGGATFVNKAKQTAQGLRNKVDEIATGISTKTGQETAGKTIEKGVTGTGGFVERFKTTSGKLFDELDSNILPEKQVSVTSTRNILNEMSAPIEGAENLSGILANNKILGIAEAFAKDAETTGKLPYTAIKQLRSKVGDLLTSSELISEAPKAQLKRLYGALSEDMKIAAKESGEDAIRAFTRANNYYKSGLQRVESLQKVVNRVDPEKIFKAVEKGDLTTIRTTMKSLKPDERNTVSATIIERLGRATPGQQDATGDVFSSSTFLTNWNKLNNNAKQALFGGTKELVRYRNDLDAIAETASIMRESSKAMLNPSGTATQEINLLATGAAVGSMMAGQVLIPSAIAGTAVTAKGTATLMTSKAFVNWLAQSTKIPIERLPGYVARLNNVLSGESDQVKSAAADYLESMGQEQPADQKQ